MVSSAAAAGGVYLHWGVINLSLANLVIVAAMVVLFLLALVLPFPQGRAEQERGDRSRR